MDEMIVTIAPQIEWDVRDLVGGFFVPVQRYPDHYRPISHEIGAAGNCRIVVDDAGMTDVRAVQAVIWENTPSLGAADEIKDLLHIDKPRGPWWSALASLMGAGRWP
jgi:hypothetical protein